MTGVVQLVTVMGENEPEKEIILEGAPSYSELLENGVGYYLKEVK